MLTVALPLKGNEFQANHNLYFMGLVVGFTVALPLKGNEFQANHNCQPEKDTSDGTVALPLKGNEFQANHNHVDGMAYTFQLLLYLSKVTNFKQITTVCKFNKDTDLLLLYLSKVTNFKQITTAYHKIWQDWYCCFTSQR